MTFEQVMTVVAVAVGPAGIGLGWWLSELGTTRRAKDAAEDREKQERSDRAIRVLAAGALAENEARNLLYTAYQRAANWTPNTEQVSASINAFQAAMRDLNRLIVEAEVFGPEGLAEIGRKLESGGRDLSGLTVLMQIRFEIDRLEAVDKETLPAFQATIEKATADVRVLLTDGS